MRFDLRLFTVGEQRMAALEGLRGVAAFAVVIHHYVNWVVERTPTGSFQYAFYRLSKHLGGTGVELFFVLSGFLIHYILMAKPTSYGVFMKRRLERIMPLACFCISIALIAMSLRGSITVPAITGNQFADIAANYLLIPGVYPVKAIYEVTWTLSYEMLFYAVCPWLVFAYRKFGFSAPARAAVSIAFIPLIFWLSDYHFAVAYFVVGVLVAEALPLLRKNAQLSQWIGFLAIIYAIPVIIWNQAIAGGFSAYPLALAEPWNMLQRFAFIGPAFFLLVAAAVGSNGSLARALESAPMRFLGAISYSLYLTHVLVLGGMMMIYSHLVPATGPMGAREYFILLCIFALLAIAFAAVTYLFIERPFSLDKKWPWESWRSLPPATAKA